MSSASARRRRTTRAARRAARRARSVARAFPITASILPRCRTIPASPSSRSTSRSPKRAIASMSQPAKALRYPSRLRRIVDQERPACAPSKLRSSKSVALVADGNAPLLVVVGDVERIVDRHPARSGSGSRRQPGRSADAASRLDLLLLVGAPRRRPRLPSTSTSGSTSSACCRSSCASASRARARSACSSAASRACSACLAFVSARLRCSPASSRRSSSCRAWRCRRMYQPTARTTMTAITITTIAVVLIRGLPSSVLEDLPDGGGANPCLRPAGGA